jgi:4-diphosphocytidyl-2-C-methyl-D-erythritol kinase
MSDARRATLPALAKINLDLRVIGRREDGFHELRTIFQTISLADSIELTFTRARRTAIELDDPLAIPNNLVERAAKAVLEALRVAGRVEMRLRKRIPMGAGLGGGSSDAAAILLGLPALCGRAIPLPELIRIGSHLGSDVPFFLLGGRAAGIGRGTELFPLTDLPPQHGALVAPGVHVSTAEAYKALGARLTNELHPNKIESFQSQLWGQGSAGTGVNDFESVVFEAHPQLKPFKSKLLKAGASSALMTGSGSALFGLFPNRAAAARAVELLGGRKSKPDGLKVHGISLVSRVRYQTLWWRALDEHIDGRIWPPRSRYSR